MVLERFLTRKEMNSPDRIDKIKSQKAKALFVHKQHYDAYNIPQDWRVPEMYVIHLDDIDGDIQVDIGDDMWEDAVLRDLLKSIEHKLNYPVFVRSCPETPRHGVIESIRCDDIEEFEKNVRDLASKMEDVDPNGCMIVMPFIKAVSSAVVAPSAMIQQCTDDSPEKWFNGYTIFGPEHDGVTAGHGFQLGFPLITGKDKENVVLDSLKYDPKTHEIEFIFDEINSGVRDSYSLNGVLGDNFGWTRQFMTQIRHAPVHIPILPPPEGVDTYGMIPKGEVVAKEVWEATGLEEVAWLEENITKDKCPEGFVVQELGGSLLSHICAHCREQEIPYVVGKVNVDERWVEAAMGWVVLDPNGDFEPKPYNPLAYKDDFLKGVELGNKYWRKQQGWFATFFHQWIAMPHGKPQDVALLAGMFSSWLAKSVLGLGLAEMRHATSRKKNAGVEVFAAISACIGEDVWEEVSNHNILSQTRGDYYVAMSKLEVNWDDAALMFDFLAKHFAKGWSKSYGGLAWGESMFRGAKLARALSAFVTESTDDNLKTLIGTVNSCENAEHNNGFLFNKWLSKRAFDVGTNGFSMRSDLSCMSQTYDMARQFLDNSFTPCNKDRVGGKQPVNDWKNILEYVMKKTPSYWRKSPLAINKNAPEILRETAKKLTDSFRHPSKGSHNDPHGDDFITCGVDGCYTCQNYFDYQKDKEIEEPITSEYEGLEDIIITKPKLEVWLAGSHKGIDVSIKDKINAMYEGEFIPDIEEFYKMYNGLEVTDNEYNLYANKLSKWLIKNKDVLTEDFWVKLKGMESE
tara:strand:- start:1736 stop:4132 length:2397 start_codon:yes stop_codon:yes gene_type:complete